MSGGFRYSGELAVHLRFSRALGAHGGYECRLRPRRGTPASSEVRVTLHRTAEGPETGETLDEAARAALAQAFEEGHPVDVYAEHDGEDWRVTRTPDFAR